MLIALQFLHIVEQLVQPVETVLDALDLLQPVHVGILEDVAQLGLSLFQGVRVDLLEQDGR